MDKQKILELASALLLAGATGNGAETEEISARLAAELRLPISANDGADNSAPPPIEQDKTGYFLNFTKKEILKMPIRFRKYFIAADKLVHVRRRKRSKHGYHYEARYRCGDYNISVSSTNPDELPEKFIAAVQAIETGNNLSNVPTNFHEFATYFFETFWRRTVAKETFKTETNRYKNHIQPAFGSLAIKNITPAMCQALLDGITAKGYGKTADEVYGRLNQIFEAAIKHGLIKYNPLALVVYVAHECKNGKALTKEEERRLLELTAGTVWQLMFAVALYTGLRPNEYKTARIEDNFIIAVNSKRKNGKIEYKKIPITPMLRPYLVGIEKLRFYVPQRIREKLRAIMPGFTLKDLRKTFNSRCIECGVNEYARKLFMGHSLGALGNAYTDLSDEFLIEEGNKFVYDLPPILPPQKQQNDEIDEETD